MSDFRALRYYWTCQGCGKKEHHVKVGVTSVGELLIEWECQGCRKEVLVRVPLENLIAEIPVHPDNPLSETDRKFLKDFHILDDEQEAA